MNSENKKKMLFFFFTFVHSDISEKTDIFTYLSVGYNINIKKKKCEYVFRPFFFVLTKIDSKTHCFTENFSNDLTKI